MKRTISIILILALLALSPAALCEDTNETQGDFFDQARDWWNAFSADASETTGALKDLLTQDAQSAWASLGEFANQAESWLDENLPGWNEDLAQAWSILKQAAIDGSAEAKARALAAYETIRAWIEENGDTLAEDARAVLDALAAAAGVAQAALSDWVRQAQDYLAEHKDELDQQTREAWNTIKQAAADAGSVAADALREAGKALKAWLESRQDSDNAPSADALEEIIDAMPEPAAP